MYEPSFRDDIFATGDVKMLWTAKCVLRCGLVRANVARSRSKGEVGRPSFGLIARSLRSGKDQNRRAPKGASTPKVLAVGDAGPVPLPHLVLHVRGDTVRRSLVPPSALGLLRSMLLKRQHLIAVAAYIGLAISIAATGSAIIVLIGRVFGWL
jgi:hypothetical protein